MQTEQVNLRLPKTWIEALKVIAETMSAEVGEKVSHQDVIRLVLKDKFSKEN